MRSFTQTNHRPLILRRARVADLLRGLIAIILLASLLPVSAAQAEPTAPPNLIAPADLATVTATGYDGSVAAPPAALPLFRWSAVAGTTNYRLQISQDIAFTVKYEFVTPLTQFNPAVVAQFSDGVWFWRVRVDTPVASEYSLPRSFTRQWASPDNSPVLLSPVDAATLQFYNSPDFSWQHAVGASNYRFQIASDPSFSVSAILYNVVTLADRHQPNYKLPNGDYYWRVIPINAANREGTPSQVRAFTMAYAQVPTQLEPANGSQPTFTPTFRWKAVPGAQFYRLQYSTDVTFNTAITQIDTRNTSYTPTATLPNNVNYYWRVRTHSNQSISDWSPTFVFLKRWYIKPQLLTPTNLFQNVRFPFFSWAPVPGAQYYQIEMDDDPSFNTPEERKITANPFFDPQYYSGDTVTQYWRVKPFDGSGREGVWSDAFSFQSYYESEAPQLVYPFYYYEPNNFPAPDEAVEMVPYMDNTVAYPVFTWLRVSEPWPVGGLGTDEYRLQLSTTPNFSSVVATIDTQTANATLESADGFTPTANQIYYWRVCPLNGAGTDCQMSTLNGHRYWSQVHPARFDLDPQPELPPVITGHPVRLLRPAQGGEFVEYTPLFEWFPKQGADSYRIEVSRDTTFSTLVDSATVPYPAYAPRQAYAQRSLNDLDYGTYYWRVRAYSGGSPLDAWSPTWRFQIAAQSGWMFNRIHGAAENRRSIGSDPDDTVNNNYELTTLYAAQDKDYWYFGFDALTGSGENMSYALYLDLDHDDNSGATSSPANRNYNISTIPAYQPEYIVYIDQFGSSFSANNVEIYHWLGGSWDVLTDILTDVGGAVYRNGSYTELKIPNTAIGQDVSTGSYAVMLASVNTSTNTVVDTVPNQANPSAGLLANFTSVSDKSNLVYPRDNIEGDLDTQPHPFIPPLFWEYPVDGNLVTPWAGAELDVHLDQAFTSLQKTYVQDSSDAYYASSQLHSDRDLSSDDSFYWRERTRYLIPATPEAFGAWSEGWRFERIGFVPVDLQVNVTFATPRFSWSRVEGAAHYLLQVDNDPNFGTPAINITTTEPSYTPTQTLTDGTYYWRVRVVRYLGAVSEFTPTQTFTLQLPAPQNLVPNDPAEQFPVNYAPTLCWDDILRIHPSEPLVPVLAAYRYRVEVSKGDPTFSVLYDSVETEQRCWTPIKGYEDGSYYWRVAMIDGDNRRGVYSAAARFLKQYPVTTLVSPIAGGQLSGTPTFQWTPVDAAASYRIEVANNSSFSPLYDTIVTNSVLFTPTKLYPDSSIIYWRVAMIDQHNRLGPFTDAIILDPNADLDRIFLPMARRQ